MKSFLGALFFVGVIILFFYLLKDCSDNMFDEIDNFQGVVGDTIIFQNDTLMIIDCSILNNSYTLEDGRTINSELVSKLGRIGKKND